MRMLFTTVAALGNFNPLIPLARAFQSQGHEVAFATAARFGPIIEGAGFEALPAGLDILYNEYLLQFPPGPIGPTRFAEIFVDGLARPMLTDLLKIMPAWRPDLIVHEVVEFGGLTAGEILKIPHVVHNLILFGYSPDLLDFLVGREYAAFRERHGLPPDPEYDEYFRYLYLQHVPESIAPLPASIAARSQLIRPEFPEAQAGALPAWMQRLPELPTVYVTLGTVYNHTPGLLEGILAALGDGQYNVIVTVGADRDPAELGSQPLCVHVERYLPQAAILPLCDVMVCHGGSGTLLGALAEGLPMLIIPLDGDHFISADRLSGLGVARVLQAPEVTSQSISAGVQALLTDPAYRQRATAIREDIAAMPSPVEVARMLVERVSEWSAALAPGKGR
jgi:UDP:flavonoid glycosyltransferase YjiC (YdhE family)